MNQKRTIKAWAVIWRSETAREYGVKVGTILTTEPEPDLDGTRYTVQCTCHPRGWHFISVLTLFEMKKEAVAWRKDNKGWQVVPVVITFTL